MRLQADVLVADIILSVVGRRFFHLNQSQIPPVSLSHLVQLKTNQSPKEDEKVKSDSQVT